jgi:hypothetical protein
MQSVAMELSAHVAAFLSLLLVVSAIHKYVERDRLGAAAVKLARVDLQRAPALLMVAALFEVGAAIALCATSTRAVGGFLAALVWSGYLALIVRAVRSGVRNLDCGCSFGVIDHARSGAGKFEIVRNLALVGMAVYVVATAQFFGSVSVGTFALMSGLLILVLYAVVDQLAANVQMRSLP